MKIAIVGAGYVGLANAILFAQYNNVTILDISQEKVDLINHKKSTISDAEIEEYLANKPLHIKATSSPIEAYKNTDFVIVCTPTDYDEATGKFDTSNVESVVSDVLSITPQAVIVIKSTVPIGYTKQLSEALANLHGCPIHLFFCPEFLREGKALHDTLYPSRIVIGDQGEHGQALGRLLRQGALKQDIPMLYTSSSEAEAIKLFSNTYLAMRVAYFNELDTYATSHGLNTRSIINGVCLDPRIGDYYNNPSFGYGGYCLPKDTKQLLASYQSTPQKLIHSIVASNKTRQDFITQDILKNKPKTVGIYRLTMKHNADNIRTSSIQAIVRNLQKSGLKIIIYEPLVKQKLFLQECVERDISAFKKQSDIIITNRMVAELNDVREKVYTRDLFGID